MQRVSKFADFQTCDYTILYYTIMAIPLLVAIGYVLGNFIPSLFNASKGLILSISTDMNCKLPETCSFYRNYHDGQLRVRFACHGKWHSTDKIWKFFMEL